MRGMEHAQTLEQLAGLVRALAEGSEDAVIGHTRGDVAVLLRFSVDRARCVGRCSNGGGEWNFQLELRGRSAKFQVLEFPRESTLYYHRCDERPEQDATVVDQIYVAARNLKHMAAFLTATEGIRQSGFPSGVPVEETITRLAS